MSTTLEDNDVSKTGQLIRNDIETECDKQKVLPANQHMTTVLLPPQEIVLDELDGLSSAGNDQHGVSNDSVYLHKDNSSMEETSGTLGETSGTLAEQEHEKEVLCKVTDGQPVQLEDGTMAFLHTTAREGAQPIQLEDGSTAYISPAPSDASFMSQGTAHVQDDGNLVSKSEEAVNSMRKECMVTDNGSGVVKFTMTPDRILQLGEKAYRCSFSGCGRLYSTQHHLKVHERSHTGDRPFRCEYEGCGKGFATGYGLKSHTRVHTGEKPYKCPEGQCSKAFKTSGDLQKHIRIHTGERPFKCPFEGCDRSFTTSNIRKVHIRTHTGEKPYVCTHDGCNRTFASATNYKNHIRIHTGEKPYVCTVDGCQKRFTEYSSLYKHHVVHTHQKPYVCNHCGKTYRQTSTLTMHKRTVHNDNTTPEMEAEFARQNEVREYSNHEEPQDGALVINTSESQQVTMVTGLPSSQAVTTLPVSRLQGAQVVTVSTGEQGEQIYVVTDPSQLLQLGLQVEQQPMAQDDPAEDGQSALSIVQSAEHAEEILQPLDQQ